MTPSPAFGLAGRAYVYLLRSMKDGRFYTGWTMDLERRFKEHNAGVSISTRNRGPFELLHYETFSSPGEAKNREKTLKRNSKMLYNFKKRAFTPAPKAQRQGMG